MKRSATEVGFNAISQGTGTGQGQDEEGRAAQQRAAAPAGRGGLQTQAPGQAPGQATGRAPTRQAAQHPGGAPAPHAVPPQPPAMYALPGNPGGGHARPFNPLNPLNTFPAFGGPGFHPGRPPSAPPAGPPGANNEAHTNPRVRAQRPADTAPGQRYTCTALNKLSELVISEASAEELAQLARALPANETITEVTLDGTHPETAKATLDALRHNHTVQTLRIELSLVDFAPKLVDKLTALLEKKTPLQHLELIVTDEGMQKFSLDQAFFMALFTHPHLTSFKLHGLYVERIYLHNPQQLAAAVRSNTRLTHLKFFCCQDPAELFKAIAPGLEGNSTLKTLDLRRSHLRGCGPAMAAVLKANKGIEKLNMQLSSEVSADDWAQIIDALAVNTTVEEFYFHNIPSSSDQRPALGASLGAMLKSNQTLTALSIYSKLDLANLTPIREGLDANPHLRFFDPGDYIAKENATGTTDAADALGQLLATNTHLTAVKLRKPPVSALKGLERNRSISSVWLRYIQDIDEVAQLLNSNPGITDLKLTRFMDDDVECEVIAHDIEALVERISGITTLLKFSIDFGDDDKLKHPAIAAALVRVEDLVKRNRQLDKERQQQLQRIAAPAIGLQMLTSFRHNDDEHWPTLGEEEALAIAGAIDTTLPPEEAQRVLDVLRFADIRPS